MLYNYLQIDFMHFSVGSGIDEKFLFILLPIIILQIILIIISYIDLKKRDYSTKIKVIWAIVILSFAIFGAVIYFIAREAHKDDYRDSESN